jgi:hypothetical protein
MPLLVALLLSSLAFADPARLRYSPDEILEAVAQYKKITLREDIPKPQIFFESNCTLKQFQDAIEPQWHMRPDAFLNAYIFAKNEIYLIDEPGYYVRLNRFIDDSLAHELVHYIQVKYQGFTAQYGGEDMEGDAIGVQTWFRETYMRRPLPRPPAVMAGFVR